MNDPLNLSNRVALITGGASGIGKGAALAFAEHGARLALVDVVQEDLDKVAEEVRRKGTQVETFVADVSDADQVRRACDGAVEKFGRLDIVYANAGVNGVWAPIEELSPEEFDKTIAINLRGTFLTIKYAVPHLRRQGGAVVVTSSVNGTRTFSNTGATAYSTSKAGQVAMAKMLAVELGNYGIRVNVICPGAISTNIGENTEQRDVDQIKVPAEYPEGTSSLTGSKPGTIDQVGQLALFLVSDMAAHITGEVVYIDAGSSLVVG
ncbi:3-ketoacyl-(acyl-carrier-protein) reductase [Fimbriimonas ginsengisoli Gsoil 348]|uniref:3-ketoacyl-(Acyl-carrier-protein) reductase n=1 Tax=Fimbriimonas ginsengisoli Gsoil 348 TaxID=661478 RepID=A0A068NTS8_FIMGI|nr:SDR family NAD(P)-dependent oxidoreductase [Fimbriimonas ginsengisoli]AIE86767.1 3-ketoacyl-(acyl-carrier-protein) reductase [Fimbriimonas ginsengisoli Gsoil 348]